MKVKRSKKRKAGRETRTIGRRLIEGMQELDDWLESGEPLGARFTVRTVHDVPQPAEYDGKRIANLRHRVGASQAVFAKMIGASVPLVCAWERGGRRPSPMARRLLDEISRDPERWAAFLHSQSAA